MTEFIARQLYNLGVFFVACSVWVDTYVQYRKAHSARYAAKIAYEIAFKGAAF